MSDVFFKELEIPAPKYNLAVNSVSNTEMTSEILKKLDAVIKDEGPDMVLVYGDTNSTLAGALAARQNQIMVSHVEAGMRSFNMKMAEELNRVITDRISDFLFCSTETAINNLLNEGFESLNCEMLLCGDVMYDAALYYGKKVKKTSPILADVRLKEYVLVTVHRAENVDDKKSLSQIAAALNKINEKVPVLLPLHPRTKKRLDEAGVKLRCKTINPVGYLEMIQLLKHCRLVITDSGGLQKEAFFFNKNCITLREETEWTELVKHGFNILAGADEKKILTAFDHMMKNDYVFKLPLYGDGNAAKKMAEYLKEKFN
jgi:UDP-GlcNAc3NAcA epimerase